jgi:hypothetical protein
VIESSEEQEAMLKKGSLLSSSFFNFLFEHFFQHVLAAVLRDFDASKV